MLFGHFSLKPCATILAHGQPPTTDLLKRYFAAAQQRIALDGAAIWAIEQGCRPDVVVGDMDSCDLTQLGQIKLIHESEQESNDLAKALQYCKKSGFKNIVVLGAFGRRSDHFLTNIYVLKQFAGELNTLFIDDNELAFMCPSGKNLALNNMKGQYLSLFPMDTQVGPISLSGVDYPLDSEYLSLTHRLGTLNKINSDEATLLCETGPLLAIVPNQASIYSAKLFHQ